ncbi:MAG: hypothetical protein R3C03_09620 [Pirellulaceae bacterium]
MREHTLQRAQQLLADRRGVNASMMAIVNVAKSNLEAAKDREQQLSLLENVDRPVQDRSAPLELISPQPGILRSLNVTAGQAVTAGTSLFEI